MNFVNVNHVTFLTRPLSISFKRKENVNLKLSKDFPQRKKEHKLQEQLLQAVLSFAKRCRSNYSVCEMLILFSTVFKSEALTVTHFQVHSVVPDF